MLITNLKSSLKKCWIVGLVIVTIGPTPILATENLDATRFEDWLLRCTSSLDDGDISSREKNSSKCVLSQQIDFEASTEPLMTIDLYLNPSNGVREAVFVLPLGIPLRQAAVLWLDGSRVLSLRASHCHRDGCYFKTDLSQSLLERFLSMRAGQLQLRGEDQEVVEIPISGAGSRAAYNYFASAPKDDES